MWLLGESSDWEMDIKLHKTQCNKWEKTMCYILLLVKTLYLLTNLFCWKDQGLLEAVIDKELKIQQFDIYSLLHLWDMQADTPQNNALNKVK